MNKPVFDDEDDDDERQIGVNHDNGFGEFVRLRKENKQLRLEVVIENSNYYKIKNRTNNSAY